MYVGDGRGGGKGTRGIVGQVCVVEERGNAYRTSQTKPSVATCFFVASSAMTSSWRVAESAGEASCLSRIFCHLLALPFIRLDH